MEKIFSYLLLGLMGVVLLSCSPKQNGAKKERPVLYVSILPEMGLAKAIVGEELEVRVLVKKNQSPHHYEPTARELAGLGDAQLLFAIGFPFEKRIIKKMQPLYPQLRVVDVSQGITRRTMHTALHAQAETDPHIWLTLQNSAILASNMCVALSKTYPDNAQIFQKNFMILQGKIRQMDAKIRKALIPFSGRTFYVFHPSFGYFADAYQLKQVAVEQDGKSPSPRQLAHLIEQAKLEGAQVVLVQKSFPPKSAKAVANAIQGKLLVLNPLAEDPLETIQKLADALKDSWRKTIP